MKTPFIACGMTGFNFQSYCSSNSVAIIKESYPVYVKALKG
jgi:hypothetical protein